MNMKPKTDPYDVGVMVGRFQVPELHEAHRALIQHVCNEHSKVVVFLGTAPLWSTRENPLDFEARKQMLLAAFPEINVLYIKDVNDDDVWSKRLDSQIKDVITPTQTVVLYGGRESFIEHYTGKFPTRELEQDTFVSGTEIRQQIGRARAKASADWRAGVVWSAYSRFPVAHPTVDIALYDMKTQRILLCRKPYEKLYRFVGGFAEPNSPSFEHDALREVHEETGLEIDDLKYIGSYQIDDWRYRKEADKIKTLLFLGYYRGGVPKPDDDIEEVRWFELESLNLDNVVPEHRILLEALLNYVQL